ncbi:MAG: type II toxin-antitoxin system HicA family toxin [Acidobacteriia bacterium]|nr:type II toxin-antitoxin system HicA family toxin [Terriglobia bacterium]
MAKALATLGYTPTRQTGSHLRLRTPECGEHHATVPQHKVLPLGTLAAILSEVAEHFGITRDELVSQIFR